MAAATLPRTPENISRLFDLSWLWAAEGSETPLDIHRPLLSAIQVGMETEALRMKENLFAALFGQVLMETTADDLKSAPIATAELAARVEAIVMVENVSEEEGALLCEVATCANGLSCLMDVQQIFTSPRSDVLFADLRCLRNTSDSTMGLLSTLALTVMDVPHLARLVTKAMENEAAILELKPVAEEMWASLDAIEDGAALRVFPRFACTLPSEFTGFLRSRLISSSVALPGFMPTGDAGEAGGDEQVLSVLSAAVQAFPDEESLVDLKSSTAKLASQRRKQGLGALLESMRTPDGASARLGELKNMVETASFANLGDDQLKLAADVMNSLVTFAAKGFPGAVVSTVHSICCELAKYVDEPIIPARVRYLQLLVDAVSLRSSMSDVQRLGTGGAENSSEVDVSKLSPTDVALTTMAVLVEKVKEYGSLVGDPKYPAGEAAGKAIQELIDNATGELTTIGDRIRNHIFAKADAALEQLNNFRGGLADGANSLDGLRKNASWKDLWALALKTIMKEKGVAGLLKPITVVSQVLAHACIGRGRWSFSGNHASPCITHSLWPLRLAHCLVLLSSWGDSSPRSASLPGFVGGTPCWSTLRNPRYSHTLAFYITPPLFAAT